LYQTNDAARLASMTLALPHSLQSRRFAKAAIGANLADLGGSY
jgi:hypothetical protein